MAKCFLKNHDFIHVNSSVAGKYNNINKMAAIGFPIRMILATVDLQVILILPMNFESVALSVQGKSSKQIFKMDAMAAVWDFLSQRFELFFIYQSLRCFLPSFESTGLSVQKKKGKKKRFLRWLPSWISDWNHFNYFYIYKSSRCFLPIFKSTGLLVQENKRKKEFQIVWIFDPNNLSYFRSTSHPNASYQVSSQMAFQFRRRSEK